LNPPLHCRAQPLAGKSYIQRSLKKPRRIGFSLVMDHAFVDGNKRIGHYAMETFLVINDYELDATVDEQEAIILQLASGKLGRDAFTDWIREHTRTME